jgi:hypothetical protein
MSGVIFKEVENQVVTNPTNLAASGTEFVLEGTRQVDFYNRLLVTNFGPVDIRVFLDGQPDRFFDVQNTGGANGFDADIGRFFKSLSYTNLSSTTAAIAGTITFTCSKAVVVG